MAYKLKTEYITENTKEKGNCPVESNYGTPESVPAWRKKRINGIP